MSAALNASSGLGSVRALGSADRRFDPSRRFSFGELAVSRLARPRQVNGPEVRSLRSVGLFICNRTILQRLRSETFPKCFKTLFSLKQSFCLIVLGSDKESTLIMLRCLMSRMCLMFLCFKSEQITRRVLFLDYNCSLVTVGPPSPRRAFKTGHELFFFFCFPAQLGGFMNVPAERSRQVVSLHALLLSQQLHLSCRPAA